MARGEHGAFDQVFTQLSYPVYCVALTVLRDHAQAEEVAQDVLAEIWRTAGRHDPAKSNVVAWALMIARRRAIDRVRSSTAGARREQKNAGTAPPPEQVSDTADEMSDRQQIRRALDSLSDLQRQAIGLAFYSGYTYTEIAAALNIPVGTVRSRIRAALIKLRDGMQTGPVNE